MTNGMTEPQKSQSALAQELPRWTIERMGLFIDTLRRTRNVAAAARAAGMSRRAAYRLRSRLPGHPFDLAWAAALAPRTAFRRMTTDYQSRASQEVTQGLTGSQPVTEGHAISQDRVNSVNFVSTRACSAALGSAGAERPSCGNPSPTP